MQTSPSRNTNSDVFNQKIISILYQSMKNLKGILISFAVAFNSIPATAEWQIAVQGPKNTVYTDPSTLRLKGDIRRIWIMESFPDAPAQAGDLTYKSELTLREYNCDENIRRDLQSTAYSEGLGAGNVVGSVIYEPTKWKHITPGTYGHHIAKAVCGMSKKSNNS